MGKFIEGMGKFLETVSPAIPVVGGIVSNVLSGINERKARLYNSPAEQVKRLREAGLPLAAGSNISAGGGISTKVSSLGTEQVPQNINASVTRQVDRKKLQIMQDEARSAKAAADIAAGEAKNKLNPSGVYENTNQGTTLMQTIAQQEAAVKNAEMVNQWLPVEKAQQVLKNNKEIDKIVQDTKNSMAQYNILLYDGQIKRIMASWEERMSKQKFDLLVKQNTGLTNTNEISALQGDIMRQTKMAQIHMAMMNAQRAGQDVAAKQMGLLLQTLETDSAKRYYTVRARADRSYAAGGEYQVFTPRDMLYLGMFNPTQSTNPAGQLLNIIK